MRPVRPAGGGGERGVWLGWTALGGGWWGGAEGDMAGRAARYSVSVRGDGARVKRTTDWKPAGALRAPGRGEREETRDAAALLECTALKHTAEGVKYVNSQDVHKALCFTIPHCFVIRMRIDITHVLTVLTGF